MKRQEFITRFGGAMTPKHDYALLAFCSDATYRELADRHWGGDRSKVNNAQTFNGTYGYDDGAMIGFTVNVEGRLNADLASANRGQVALPTGPGQVAPASSTVLQYINRIYFQSLAQNP